MLMMVKNRADDLPAGRAEGSESKVPASVAASSSVQEED